LVDGHRGIRRLNFVAGSAESASNYGRSTDPSWVPSLLVKSWSLPWPDVVALKARSTGQGGLVYYFMDAAQQGYLLPMRIAGFSKLVEIVQAQTSIDTQDVRPLAQPWMYFILLGVTVLLLLVDVWSIWTATTQGMTIAG
jgi:hypothetical protein